MKKYYSFSLALLIAAITIGYAQTTPVDFNRKDCNGMQRHLFADLDSGKAVIIEFFMINCAPCPAAGIKLEAMKSNLDAQFPGKVLSYAIAYNNTYTQAQVKSWVTSNGFNMIPMDSGAYQTAYYGGMGMPTIVILAGKLTHSVLGAPYIGFSPGDTMEMATNIRAYLKGTSTNTNTAGLQSQDLGLSNMKVYPSPASSGITVSFEVAYPAAFDIRLYDIAGREVSMLASGIHNGNYNAHLSLSNVPAGNYFVKVRSGNSVAHQKITVTK
jgi:hypothetical protein